MNKAVFLDRDGVIINNSNHYYIYKINDIEYIDGIFEACKMLSKSGFKLFIITNQSGIAREVYTKSAAEEVNKAIVNEFSKHEVTIERSLLCPHHNDTGKCLCRKPDSLMLEKIIAGFDINAKASYLIGDSERDVQAGRKAGLSTYLSEANKSISEICQSIAEV
jgi:D-glycero-D-manno-heptose 1,7-bisphosphate phosphatase